MLAGAAVLVLVPLEEGWDRPGERAADRGAPAPERLAPGVDRQAARPGRRAGGAVRR
jgi:hypothetical protein